MKPAAYLVIALFLAAFPVLEAQDNSSQDEYEEDFSGGDYLITEEGGLTVEGSSGKSRQVEVIDKETIEKIHAPDIPSLLEETFGAGVTRYGPYGNKADVNIRGFNTERIAVLVNGIPVNSAASGEFDFNSIDPASIERIEVIHGGSDTKYNVSGALGGVINIVTTGKQKPGWAIGAGISNTSFLPGRYNKAEGGVGNPQWGDLADAQNINVSGAYGAEQFSLKLAVFGNQAKNQFLYRDYYGYARRKEGNGIMDGGASASFIREFQNLSKLTAAGAFYAGEKDIPFSGYTQEHAEQRDVSSRANILFDMPRAFHDDFAMETSLGHNWKKIQYDPGAGSSLHNEHGASLTNRWTWYSSEQFTLRFGGDYYFILLDSTASSAHNEHRGGLYVSPEYSPAKNLHFNASVKGITNGREIEPIPKLGLFWTINDSIALRNNYFRSFKFPDFDDLYWTQDGFAGNPNLNNEDGWGADIGLDISHNDAVVYNTTFYGEWTEDSIHWDNSSGAWRPENSGTAAFAGWDNKLKLTLPFSPGPMEKPVLGFSWLFQLSWLLSGDLAVADSKRIPYMPMHTFGVFLEFPWKTKTKNLPGSITVSGRFESERFADTRNFIKLDPCFILNVIYNQKITRNFSLFGKINNALNTQYVSFADYPMPGISICVGIKMIFEGLGIKEDI